MSEERNAIPLILTGVGSIIVTVGALWYYGYLHFAKPEDALLLQDFTMLKTIPGRGLQRSRWTRHHKWPSASTACWCCSIPSRKA
ncbi:hypothetical protein PPS11_24563 [Pseudomonas putida S11]|nr:hypothetical protein PPS11_24563 [Pseudomonas putida S11]